jgi:probable phosphoglycerate mutase
MSFTLELCLIRHGETEWTEQALLHGRLDSPLSPRGRRHAEQTAGALAGQKFDAAYVSPRGRARQTAEIITRPLRLEAQVLAGLAEADYGWLEGRSLRRWEPDGTGPRLWRPLARALLHLTGERPGPFGRRVQAALDEMLARRPGGRLLVVTHWGVISMIMALLLDGEPQIWRRYGPWAACGITELRLDGSGWQAVRVNDHRHLDQSELEFD